MTKGEARALRAKYPPDKMAAIRRLYDQDVSNWAPIKAEGDLDIQCISTERGPWPEAEWNARTRSTPARACLHEDILTPYINQVINRIEMNPMGVECQPSGAGATVESSERLENRIRQIEYEENGQFSYQTAAKCAVERSFGWWKMESRYTGAFDQTVCIIPVTDPCSITPGFWKKPDASDMRRAWEHEWMTIEEFKERWPGAKIQSFDGFQPAGEQWAHDGQVQVCAWWHLESDERELLRLEREDGSYSDVYDGDEPEEGRVVSRRKVKHNKVLKTIMSGMEVLDETEWIDPGEVGPDGTQLEPPEIPLFGVFGRVKYENGRMIIESLPRKGRVGQLLYDFTISAIQETIAITPRVTRLGPEGTFDTSTNWDPRAVSAYKEYKPVVEPETGQPLPAPQLETYEPPIQALELAKQSILIGVQNAIGMSAVERKDKTAKSGKALDALQQEMSVGTSHYFSALRIAQERQYRVLKRIVPLLDQAGQEVTLRDKFGKHASVELPENPYTGRYSVAVGTGKLYQTLQEKQEDLSQELLKSNDPTVMMAVYPTAIRLRGIGPEGEKLADMLEAMQPPEMKQAREKDKGPEASIPPEVLQAIEEGQQQLKSLDAYAKEAEQKIQELQDQLDAQVVQSQSKEKIAAEDNLTKLKIEQMRIEAELEMERLKVELEKFRMELHHPIMPAVQPIITS